MTEPTKGSSIDTYITGFPQEVQTRLLEMRAIIRQAAPDSSEAISYAIPTFDLLGKHLVHFAAFRHHIGFYPTASGIAQFAQELQSYSTSKGTVQFPLEQPLPKELIEHIVRFREAEVMALQQKKRRRRSSTAGTDV